MSDPFQDLKCNPQTSSQPMTQSRAFTVCELAIYRFRDLKFTPETSEYKLLTDLANEILELRKSWQGK